MTDESARVTWESHCRYFGTPSIGARLSRLDDTTGTYFLTGPHLQGYVMLLLKPIHISRTSKLGIRPSSFHYILVEIITFSIDRQQIHSKELVYCITAKRIEYYSKTEDYIYVIVSG